MKFLIDANLPLALKKILSLHGDAVHANDIRLGHANDEVLAQRALREKAILVTRDLEFANPAMFPAGKHYGLLILRLPSSFTANSICHAMQHAFRSIASAELPGCITVIEPGRVRRFRRL